MSLIINLWGGPGAGKSTAYHFLLSNLKMSGFNAEGTGEEAKDLLHDGATTYYENQLLMAGLQHQRMHRLLRNNVKIIVSDSPLLQTLLYSKNLPYHEGLRQVLEQIDQAQLADTRHVFIHRDPERPYDPKGRYQTAEQAASMDSEIHDMVMNRSNSLFITGNARGYQKLLEYVVETA